MSRFAIQAGTFGKSILIGRVNKAGTAFTDKEDATDDVLFAVAEYVRQNFNGGMSMAFNFQGGDDDFELNIKVTPTPAAAIRDEVAR